MKSNLESLKNTKSKNNSPKIELKKVQEIALLWQAIIILAIVISFIMSRFIAELTTLMNIYLVILSVIMSYTSYTIYKRKSISILYIIFGIIILSNIILEHLA